MFNRAKRIFEIIKSGTEEELRAHLEKYPNSVKLKKRISIAFGDWYPTCPVMFHAAFYKKIDMLPILKEAGADIDAVHGLNSSALNIVIYHHNDGDKSYEDTIRCLAELGASTTMKNGKNAEDFANSPEIKKIFNPEYVEPIAPIKKEEAMGELTKENDYMVSRKEYAKASEVSITTVYNFLTRKVLTVTELKGKIGHNTVIQEFHQVAQNDIKAAAAFLESEQGNTHGFKPTLIQ